MVVVARHVPRKALGRAGEPSEALAQACSLSRLLDGLYRHNRTIFQWRPAFHHHHAVLDCAFVAHATYLLRKRLRSKRGLTLLSPSKYRQKTLDFRLPVLRSPSSEALWPISGPRTRPPAASCRGLRQYWLDPLTPHYPCGVEQAGMDVLFLHPGEIFQDALVCVSGGQHPQDMLDGQPPASDNGFATEYLRVMRDSLEQLRLVHPHTLSSPRTIKSRTNPPFRISDDQRKSAVTTSVGSPSTIADKRL
jgi:hypothetical protein